LKPKISPQIELMKQKISDICKINIADVGITATSGEGLTAFGKGEGIQAITIITVSKS
jgi:2-C-methyl-D-erythritol 2,4-cyclodiphosphate synthase